MTAQRGARLTAGTDWLQIHDADSVGVALRDLSAGQAVELEGVELLLRQDVGRGHKFALRMHGLGTPVIKYGYPIGGTTRDIAPGDHVHVHNLRSALQEKLSLELDRAVAQRRPTPLEGSFMGYSRQDGRAATRNELWIVPTVGCVATTAEHLAASFTAELSKYPNVEACVALRHPLGCSQLGDDLQNTQRILARLATHPNAAGTLVLGLGCENNHLQAFEPYLEDYNRRRVRFLGTQDVTDELSAGLAALRELAAGADADERTELPLLRLVVGLKCGGSDGLSGITANPTLGRFTDALCAAGGKAILTEVPEMFGAEAELLARATNEQVQQRGLDMVQRFRRYLARHGQALDKNPSPGNLAGGISTLEDKSLGCIQKGGAAPVTDVVAYGGRVAEPGLTLLEGPGNDQVSTTALAAAGATLVLFTTGRGTPLGGPVPVIKVSSNGELSRRKPNWVDFDAGRLVEGASRAVVDREFADLVLDVASGRVRTKNEVAGYRDVAIFKAGVTL